MPYKNPEDRRRHQREWKAKQRHPGLHTCPACKEPSWNWIKVDNLHIETRYSVCCPNCGVIVAIPKKEIKDGEKK